MIEREYILLIMNCKKYLKKAIYQKRTWLQKVPSYIRFYHVIGEPELDTRYKFDHKNSILWIKVDDDYNSLPKKVVRAFEAVKETYKFRYLLKTDDDQMLINDKFFDILKGLTNIKSHIHYGGYIVDVKENQLSQYHKIHTELPPNLPILKTKYCSGRFYFLSKSALENIIINKESIEEEYFEDYAIGYHLDSYFKDNMINIFTNKIFKDVEPQLIEKYEI